jgi:hypothetical protein
MSTMPPNTALRLSRRSLGEGRKPAAFAPSGSRFDRRLLLHFRGRGSALGRWVAERTLEI